MDDDSPGEIEFDARPGNDELETDRNEFYNLDSDRQLREGIHDIKQYMKSDIEMQNYTQSKTTWKKSMDTKATDDRDGIIIPDMSDEDDSLIGEQENSYIANSVDSKRSRDNLIRTRRSQERQLDKELQKMEQLIDIEKKMKKSGADLSHIMRANPKRTCLDRITVPRNFSMKSPCLKFRVSFYYCLFCIFLIDMFILLKDFIQIIEM